MRAAYLWLFVSLPFLQLFIPRDPSWKRQNFERPVIALLETTLAPLCRALTSSAKACMCIVMALILLFTRHQQPLEKNVATLWVFNYVLVYLNPLVVLTFSRIKLLVRIFKNYICNKRKILFKLSRMNWINHSLKLKMTNDEMLVLYCYYCCSNTI